MPLTLAQARTLLDARAAGLIALVNSGLADAGVSVTVAPDLALAYAAADVGGAVADPTAPTDDDLATIPAGRMYEAIDLAEVRLLEDLLGSFTQVTYTLGEQSESLSDLLRAIEQAIARKQGWLLKKYGHGVGTLSAGSIRRGSRRWPCGDW